MSETLSPKKELEDVQVDLHVVQEFLRRHRLVESLVERQETPKHEQVESPEEKQNLAQLRAKLDSMHPADIAYVLESLPLEERLAVWNLVKADRDGEILLEVSDAVRETLIRSMDSKELVAAAEQLEADEIADLAPDLPRDVMHDVFQALPVEEREQLRAAMSYPEDAVGALMDFDVVSVREDITMEVVTRYLRRFDRLPNHTDQLFVVDRDERLKGVLPLAKLIVSDLEHTTGRVMERDRVTLYPDDKAQDAAKAFERYDLVSAAVVDQNGKLVGRVTVDKVVDFIRSRTETELLTQAGLREEEDVFSSVWASVKNRWAWLATNLVTAFVASRVIGAFEGSIEKLVALAALMPIVAGIGGNSGNQTITMIVRGIALGQVQNDHAEAPGQGARRVADERPHLGRHPRADRLLAVPEGVAGSRDDGGDDPQPPARRHRRRAHSPHHAETGARPGARLERDDHRDHRQRGFFHIPGTRDADPALSRFG
jgi:magnesium transporter